MKIQPVILAGGSGSRLWPVSREVYPKQLLRLTGSKSLLQFTIERVIKLENILPPVIVVCEEHRFGAKEQIDELAVLENHVILLEPFDRSTAPAICGAAEYIGTHRDEETIMLVLPSDHLIGDEICFAQAVKEAADRALEGYIVTFGIPIEKEETGYGYIREGDAGAVASFREKPGIAMIRQFMAEGGWYWNSGIFTFTVKTLREEIAKYAPEIQEVMAEANREGRIDGDFFRLDAACMMRVEDASIDYALMEKTDRASVVRADLQWRDVGSWQAVWEIMDQDDNGNVSRGDVVLESTTNSMVIAENKLVAAVGLNDTVVVETADAVLVSTMSSAQDVKKIVKHLKMLDRDECRIHATVAKPWGSRTTLESEERYKINKIRVNPGAGLSLQKHYHRYEHWVVVSGTARITCGKEVVLLSENQSSSSPAGVLHKLENPGTIPLELIEVQIGSYLGEDDIVRYDDKYST